MHADRKRFDEDAEPRRDPGIQGEELRLVSDYAFSPSARQVAVVADRETTTQGSGADPERPLLARHLAGAVAALPTGATPLVRAEPPDFAGEHRIHGHALARRHTPHPPPDGFDLGEDLVAEDGGKGCEGLHQGTRGIRHVPDVRAADPATEYLEPGPPGPGDLRPGTRRKPESAERPKGGRFAYPPKRTCKEVAKGPHPEFNCTHVIDPVREVRNPARARAARRPRRDPATKGTGAGSRRLGHGGTCRRVGKAYESCGRDRMQNALHQVGR